MQDNCPFVLNGFDLSIKNLNLLWKKVLHLGKKTVFKKGQTVLLRDNLYYIEKGEVRRIYTSESGIQVLFASIGENSMCGSPLTGQYDHRKVIESASKNNDRKAHAMSNTPAAVSELKCITDVYAYEFSREMVSSQDFLNKYPELIFDLMRGHMIRLDYTYSMLCFIASYPPKQRVCIFFAHLGIEQGLNANPKMTQEELASFFGMHRSTMTRTIKELRQAGLIGAFTRNKLEILDLQGLLDLAYHKHSSCRPNFL